MSITKYILTEQIQNVLYHFTNDDSLYNILNSNKLNFSLSLGTQSDQLMKGYMFFLSTTRTNTGKAGYARNKNIRIQLDKDKLQNKYKIKPVDYWGMEFRKVNPIMSDETEERILATNDSIDGVDDYILSVDYYLSPHSSYTLIYATLVSKLCKDKGIDIYFFEDENAYRNQNRNKATDIQTILSSVEIPQQQIDNVLTKENRIFHGAYEELVVLLKIIKPELPMDSYIKGLATIYVNEYKKIQQDQKEFLKNNPEDIRTQELYIDISQTISKWNEDESVLYNQMKEKLIDNLERQLDYISNAYGALLSDRVSSVESVIHNNKKNNNPIIRNILTDIVKQFKKMGWNSVKEMVIYTRDKIQDELKEQ